MGDVYDRYAMEDEFGDDLDDLAMEISVLRSSEKRQADTITAMLAEVEELQAALADERYMTDNLAERVSAFLEEIEGENHDSPCFWLLRGALAGVGDVRRAAALLRDKDGEDDGEL